MTSSRAPFLLYHSTRGPLRSKTCPVGDVRRAGRVSVVRHGRAELFDLFVDESGNTWAKKSARKRTTSKD